MTRDPELAAHKEWLGLVQPVGLVVSPPALLSVQVVPSRDIVPQQEALRALTAPPDAPQRSPSSPPPPPPRIADFADFAQELLGWEAADLVGLPPSALPDDLCVPLPDYGETLRPTYAVPDPAHIGSSLLLVQVLPAGTPLDERPAPAKHEAAGWHATPQAKFERLLRETAVPIGLLCNGDAVRLCYAPSGETSGHLTFPVEAMTRVAGRPILAALLMLLEPDRLFAGPVERRLPAILAESRKYQNEVSTQLAEQVLLALLDLLRGIQVADGQAGGRVLDGVRSEDIYGGLLTVILRLVFLLYAEERSLLPGDAVYELGYSVTALFDRLREDAGQNPDTMDQRYGAWAHLCSLFRLVYDGASHGACHLPARHGDLFDPDRYPFLEGRPPGDRRPRGEPLDFDVPQVPDGVVEKVLRGLLILSGERLSYRALDVEQIGSVYEAMMGYAVERAAGPSLAVRPHHVVVNLAELLKQKPADRAKWLKEGAGCELAAKDGEGLKAAQTVDAAAAALGKKVSPRTPQVLPAGALYLQPGEERRRSGSHYTPRALTQPIVSTALRPVLAALGERPTAEQVLGLKVCDPAMGSGAFLVEACRHLGDRLVAAWEQHGSRPEVPPDEDPLLHARRLVAQRCLYGVDKNPFAVNLAKLSLWLVTLAKDHAFTFLDHSLKNGDSLVGLTRRQVGAFSWQPEQRDSGPLFASVKGQVDQAREHREAILALGEDGDEEKRELHREAEDAIAGVRLDGDLVVAAFFAEEKDKAREERRREYQNRVLAGEAVALQGVVDELRGERKVLPFHWEIEFPEVFGRENAGFDAIVGNPPFLGGSRISSTTGSRYLDWLLQAHPESHGNGDLVAHFFRRAFNLLRDGGTFGLIATNTIAQGDTRTTGLRWICQHGGAVFNATKRLRWPGFAAVIVSVVNVQKARYRGPRILDGRLVGDITALLFHAGGHENPAPLKANKGKSFAGSKIYGQGFIFDDKDEDATPLSEMHRIVGRDRRNSERVFAYIGGAELNTHPAQEHHRYVINFSDMSQDEAEKWPDLMHIVAEKVKPERLKLGDNSIAERRKESWWLWGSYASALYRAIEGLERVLACSQVSAQFCFAFQPSTRAFAHTLNVFASDRDAFFAITQSRIHEIWARFFGSSMKDDLRYTPTDCFETFPFPENWEQHAALEAIGKTYYEYRAKLMLDHQQGLTATYNRFHDPDELDPGILRLRELHAHMDRAVLHAYGWQDIPTTCTFRLDYEEDNDGEDDSNQRRKKKPYRYRWPQEVHDEVLARLLDLNQQRAQAERLAGAAAQATKPKKAAKPPAKARAAAKKDSAAQPLSLFGPKDESGD